MVGPSDSGGRFYPEFFLGVCFFSVVGFGLASAAALRRGSAERASYSESIVYFEGFSATAENRVGNSPWNIIELTLFLAS